MSRENAVIVILLLLITALMTGFFGRPTAVYDANGNPVIEMAGSKHRRE